MLGLNHTVAAEASALAVRHALSVGHAQIDAGRVSGAIIALLSSVHYPITAVWATVSVGDEGNIGTRIHNGWACKSTSASNTGHRRLSFA